MLKKFNKRFFTIRIAKEFDIPDIAKLQNKLFNPLVAWSKKDIKNRLTQDTKSIYLVVYQDLHLVAFIGVRFLKKEAHVSCIMVAPRYQHMHIATNLMKFVIDLAKKRKNELVSLEVSSENIPALKLYSSLGFKEMFKRKNYYMRSIDAINMVYWLTK